MHHSSMQFMAQFRATLGGTGTVLDVGSLNVNGSYRTLFSGWDYVGVDVVSGPGVDHVLSNPHSWEELDCDCFDVVISGQTFEHIEDDHAAMREVRRVLVPGGLCCIIAPSAGHLHDFPKDYRRYTADSMRELAEAAGLDVIEAEVKTGGDKVWKDCVLIARKGERTVDAEAETQDRPVPAGSTSEISEEARRRARCREPVAKA